MFLDVWLYCSKTFRMDIEMLLFRNLQFSRFSFWYLLVFVLAQAALIFPATRFCKWGLSPFVAVLSLVPACCNLWWVVKPAWGNDSSFSLLTMLELN